MIRSMRCSRARPRGISRTFIRSPRAGACGSPKSTPASRPDTRISMARSRSRASSSTALRTTPKHTGRPSRASSRRAPTTAPASRGSRRTLDCSRCARAGSRPRAKALQFALDQRVQIVNLSLGGPRDRLLERLLDVAASREVTVVAAADPMLRDGGFPASHRGVLAIAGEDVHDLAADILRAPARDIPTTLVGAKWGFVTGSSYAAAHVSGLVALLRELSPNLRPQQLRDALVPHAVPGSSAAPRLIVDACAAVARTTGNCACGCALARDTKASL